MTSRNNDNGRPTLPSLPASVSPIARALCYGGRLLPRGWARTISLTAEAFPCLHGVEVSIEACGPMFLDLRESVCVQLFKFGCYPHQLPEDNLLQRIIQLNTIVFDLGANIGYYTRFFSALVGESGTVIAVEPMPRAIRLLQQNIKLGRRNIHGAFCAVGECKSRATLNEAAQLDISRVDFSEEPSTCGDVDVLSIDELADEFGQPDLIKIDIEGAELHALRGAQRVLNHRNPPILLFEYVPSNATHYGSYSLPDVVGTLPADEPSGYTVYRVAGPLMLVPWDADNSPGLTNDYLAVPCCKMERIKPILGPRSQIGR